MSVVFPINADPRFRLSTAVGGETAYSVPFPFQDNDDIVVVRYADAGDVTGTVLVLGAHYTLTGAGAAGGGTVTLAAPAVAGQRYLRIDKAVLDRVTTIIRNGRFSSHALDSDLDRFIIIAQELARDLERSVKVPVGASVAELPTPVADKFWKWSADATRVEFVDILSLGEVAASAYMQSLFGSADAATARAALGLPNFPLAAGNLAPGSVSLVDLVPALADTVPLLTKVDRRAVAFTKTGLGTAQIKAGTVVKVGTTLVNFNTATTITMPTLTVGHDYAIFVSAAGAIEAVAWTANTGTSPTPPAGGTWVWIGGFHYAAGGNSTGWNAGGDAIPQISINTFYDDRFRPACDPRGMYLVADRYFVDYYHCGINHHLKGTSRYGETIAVGDNKPKLPEMFGGNGSTLVAELDWWAASEIADSHRKRLMLYTEYQTACFGVIEELGRSMPAITTGHHTTNNSGATYKDHSWTGVFGGNLLTGNYYTWAQGLGYGLWPNNYDFSGPIGIALTDPQTRLEAKTHMISNGRARGGAVQESQYATRGVLVGGKYGVNASAGSRGIDWANGVQTHSPSIGMRFAADLELTI